MHASRSLLPLVVVLALAAQVTLAGAPQNDAGLGGDAGNTRDAATPLPAYGSYQGELRSHDDDWYTTLRAPGPACATLAVTGDTYANATLAIRTGTATYGVRAPIVENATTLLAVAGSGVTQTWEGFVRTPNPAGNDAARPKYYNFTLVERQSAGEGGAPGDAGSSLGTARAIRSGCWSGSLQPLYGLGDALDAYAFTLPEPTEVVYSVGASAPVQLRLVDETGAPAGPSIGGDQIALASLPQGTFYVQLSATTVAEDALTYVFSLMGPDPPPGSPCRPHCVIFE